MCKLLRVEVVFKAENVCELLGIRLFLEWCLKRCPWVLNLNVQDCPRDGAFIVDRSGPLRTLQRKMIDTDECGPKYVLARFSTCSCFLVWDFVNMFMKAGFTTSEMVANYNDVVRFELVVNPEHDLGSIFDKLLA